MCTTSICKAVKEVFNFCSDAKTKKTKKNPKKPSYSSNVLKDSSHLFLIVWFSIQGELNTGGKRLSSSVLIRL